MQTVSTLIIDDEPLAREIEVALVARPGEDPGELSGEGDLERHRAPGRYGLGQQDTAHRLVVRVAVVGLDEGQ